MTPQDLFFNDPWWLSAIKALLVLVVLLVWTIMNVWFERRLFAKMLQRVGPSMNGPFGWLQTLAEGLKNLLKEDFAPGHVDKWVYNLAPVLTGVCAFSTWAVMPLGGKVRMFGHETYLQLVDLPVGILYVLAVASIGIYGIVLAGWASSDAYSLLGGLRSSAQMISYEVSMGLSLVPVFLMAGTMSTTGIVEAQGRGIELALPGMGVVNTHVPGWYVLLLPSFIIFFISALGEANRTPFDLTECEQELVSGHITEYTGFRFALYYLGEYIAMCTQSAVIVTLFLGGWHAPWPLNLIGVLDGGWFGFLWFVIKTQLVIFTFIWIRAALPRYRYDQFMALGWKRLIPIALGWVLLVATWRVGMDAGWFRNPIVLGVAALIVVGVLIWSFVGGKDEEREKAPARGAVTAGEFDPFAGGYPVPPLPGQVLPGGRTVVATEAREV